MTTVSVRLDDQLKKDLENVCDEMGITMATCFTIYAKRVVRDRGIPFDVSAGKDPFDSGSNRKALLHSIRQLEDGRTVTRSLEELEALADA